jgi:phage replication O-like protein O
MQSTDSFVRIPTSLLVALMRSRLSGCQWRVLLWVIRNTYGWNRPWATFTWYRLAKTLDMNRSCALRAGKTLLAAKILGVQSGQVGIQVDSGLWDKRILVPQIDASRQLLMPGIDGASKQRKPMPPSNECGPAKQPRRCQGATLFRRAKDSSKDRLKTYKDRREYKTDDARQRQKGALGEPPASAAPIPGKYERLS